MEIVDAHVHLFEQGRRTAYLLPDLIADANDVEAVTQAIYIECGSGYRSDGPEHLKSVGETESVTAAIDAAPGGLEIAGIVGFADLTGPAFAEVLDAHEAAGRGLFKGVRQAAAWDADAGIPPLPQRPAPDLMDRDEFCEGLATLGARRLSYDVYLYHPQLAQLARAARAVPETTIVLNHLGSPLSVGRYSGRREEVLAAWRDGIVEVAECPNVAIKIGGLGMPLFGFASDHPAATSSRQLADAWRPLVVHVLAAFGADRCMAESNFPVDRATCSYAVVWEAIQLLIGDLAPEGRQLVLAETARRLYRL